MPHGPIEEPALRGEIGSRLTHSEWYSVIVFSRGSLYLILTYIQASLKVWLTHTRSTVSSLISGGWASDPLEPSDKGEYKMLSSAKNDSLDTEQLCRSEDETLLEFGNVLVTFDMRLHTS
jgi:hypothetical protein